MYSASIKKMEKKELTNNADVVTSVARVKRNIEIQREVTSYIIIITRQVTDHNTHTMYHMQK